MLFIIDIAIIKKIFLVIYLFAVVNCKLVRRETEAADVDNTDTEVGFHSSGIAYTISDRP